MSDRGTDSGTPTGLRFEHQTFGQRIYFASGDAASALASEVALLRAERVMLISSTRDSHLARRLTDGLPIRLVHDEVAEHVPTPVAERARAAAADNDIDLIISLGGGSATGLAKAVVLTSGVPVAAVPTTYAGSEATSVWGLTEGATKITGNDPRVLPRAIIYDATLLRSLPVELSVASGLNALAHCIDSMWAPRRDPINLLLAEEGTRALAAGMPRVVDYPLELSGIEQTLYGAYLAAVAFASAGSGLHHKICHVLGGRYGLPHAPTHAIVLPHVLALNAPAAPNAERRIARALNSASALGGLQALRERLDAPCALRDYGFTKDQIGDAVTAILPSVPESNPLPVTPENLYALLTSAYEGSEPR